MSYKLKCAIKAHSNDVRAIAVEDGCIVSVSRDRTAKLWTLNECTFEAHCNDVRGIALCEDEIVTVSNDRSAKLWIPTGTGYESVMTYVGHEKFVTSVCILLPSSEFGNGLILTGGQDGKILGFDPFKSTPLIQFAAHSLCVCSLARALVNPHYFLSASWDGTGHLWDAVSQRPLSTFSGHSQAVWCILQVPEEFTVITGSADCTINMYMPSGVLIATLKGHEDCVRGLVYVGSNYIASCSNDGTVRKWHIGRKTCSQIIHASKSYIYSLSVLVTPKADIFAYGGEDKFFCIQKFGRKTQEISQPAQSVWASAVMDNYDVVVGTSDGFVRIFTSDPSRQADEDEQLAFEKEVEESCKNSGESTPMDLETLPGREALHVPGKRDGDTMFIKEGNRIVSYIWHEDKAVWRKMSIKEGSAKGSSPSKILYQGQEYDFLFDVEVAEGLEPLKLPYNIGEDPVEAARKFIMEYNLSPMYLEEITDFLITNAVAASETLPSTSFDHHTIKQDSLKVSSETVYPLKQMIFFESFDPVAVYKKLDEFWIKAGFDNKYDGEVLDCVKSLHKHDIDHDKVDIALPCLLDCMSKWAQEIVFPILDIVRIVFLRSTIHTYLFNRNYARSIFEVLDKRFMRIETLAINKMFVFRIITNLLYQKEGQDFVFENKTQLLPKLKTLVTDTPYKGLEVAASTFVLDLSFLGCLENDLRIVNLCLQFIEHAIYKVNESEAKFRLCVAIGTICLRHGENILSIAVINKLKEMAALRETEVVSLKAISCARGVLNSFKNH